MKNLDLTIAELEGRAMRQPQRARLSDVEKLVLPFKLYETVYIARDDKRHAAEVREITVTGRTEGAIGFVDSSGQPCLGQLDMFFTTRQEAELDCKEYLHGSAEDYHPSTSWQDGGPIIERERICLEIGHDGLWLACIQQNHEDDPKYMTCDKSPLVAAMQTYAKSRLNDVRL